MLVYTIQMHNNNQNGNQLTLAVIIEIVFTVLGGSVREEMTCRHVPERRHDVERCA